MITLWYVIYMSVVITLAILIPFGIFMYESDDEKPLVSISSKIKDQQNLFLFTLRIGHFCHNQLNSLYFLGFSKIC